MVPCAFAVHVPARRAGLKMYRNSSQAGAWMAASGNVGPFSQCSTVDERDATATLAVVA